MNAEFDPYHKWLGIPASEQPANHYRLLGVALYEQDLDVIDAAANQRMSYLQDMASGPNVEHSQRVLNEVSAARRCLLNPDQKAIYDAALRQRERVESPTCPLLLQLQGQGRGGPRGERHARCRAASRTAAAR